MLGIYFKVHKCDSINLWVKGVDMKDYGKNWFNEVRIVDTNIYSFRKLSNFEYITLKLKSIVK